MAESGPSGMPEEGPEEAAPLAEAAEAPPLEAGLGPASLAKVAASPSLRLLAAEELGDDAGPSEVGA